MASDNPIAEAPPIAAVPLLSICVPTYNRAGWLRAMLATVVPQARTLGGLVEVVVSDNASDDDTESVVENAQSSLGPVRYNRNAANIGGEPNFHKAVSQIARGKYAWLLGDDDFLAPGALRKVISAIEENPDVDYFYVNYRIWECDSPPLPGEPIPEFQSERNILGDISDGRLDSLMEIVGHDPNLFTPISCSIMRREMLAQAVYRDPALESFASAKSVTPISLYIAGNRLRLPAYSFGEPLTILGTASSWDKYHPAFMLIVLPELYDYYEKNGVPRSRIDAFRRILVRDCVKDYHKMQSDPSTPGHKHFSMWRFLWQNRRDRAAFTLHYRVFLQPKHVAPVSRFLWSFAPSKAILQCLRGVWHQLRGCSIMKDY